MDFSRPYWSAFHAVVIPLEIKSKMWYIVDPFHFNVWLMFGACIPLYIIAMGLTNYFYHGFKVTDWDDFCGFLIRNALSEQNSRIPDRAQGYQKILIITWIWTMLVIVQAYSGNLTAMLAKPKLQPPIRSLEELLNQEEISWVIEKQTLPELYMKTSPIGSVMNKLYNGATLMPQLTFEEKIKYGSYAKKLKESGKFGSIENIGWISQMYAKDFGETGKCNYYIMEEKFLSSENAMAFQVRARHIYVVLGIQGHRISALHFVCQ